MYCSEFDRFSLNFDRNFLCFDFSLTLDFLHFDKVGGGGKGRGGEGRGGYWEGV